MSVPYLSLILLLNSFLSDIWARLNFLSSLSPWYVDQFMTLPIVFIILDVISVPTSIVGPKYQPNTGFSSGYWIGSSLNISNDRIHARIIYLYHKFHPTKLSQGLLPAAYKYTGLYVTLCRPQTKVHHLTSA